jgi:hypothetical protein
MELLPNVGCPVPVCLCSMAIVSFSVQAYGSFANFVTSSTSRCLPMHDAIVPQVRYTA